MLYSLVIPITSLAVGGVNIFVIHPVGLRKAANTERRSIDVSQKMKEILIGVLDPYTI